MALAWCAVSRSASNFASLCGGRVRIISTVLDRPSLALNPSPLRPFVSSSFYYPAVVDQLSSEQMLIREIDSEINLASQISDMFKDEETTPESSPFIIEDDGGETVTLTRDYKGEHIKVVVGLPSHATKNEEGTLDYYYNYYGYGVKIPLTMNITKKSGLSLEFRCKVIDEYDWIHIDGVFGDHSVDSLKDKLANGEGTYFK
ncbi:PREDICTED: uncharacterized protein At2g39795, mitochondrial-like [Camelina sativa]|uniref:Uncharacterized protein At2g39795, mitochondrial-like n=1 Tax=Camelina sativa TaxID=90675 RepID=A0ABM0YXV8_CAMSA|nr:PREDICTED: uncharacterized protein At2g39795, mitochondrial-like [Camelina sativa]